MDAHTTIILTIPEYPAFSAEFSGGLVYLRAHGIVRLTAPDLAEALFHVRKFRTSVATSRFLPARGPELAAFDRDYTERGTDSLTQVVSVGAYRHEWRSQSGNVVFSPRDACSIPFSTFSAVVTAQHAFAALASEQNAQRFEGCADEAEVRGSQGAPRALISG